LAEEPWLIKFLIAQGFQRTSGSTFSNGRATLRFDRSQFFAIPGNGSKGWHSDLSDAEPETIRQLLSHLLAAPAFQSQAQLDRRAHHERLLEQSLENIAASILKGPETHSGQQLRRFLWSLYNGHHVLNLWSLKNTLDSQRGGWVSEVFCGWLQGFVSEEALRKALTATGNSSVGKRRGCQIRSGIRSRSSCGSWTSCSRVLPLAVRTPRCEGLMS
jgi:hypothetical protein